MNLIFMATAVTLATLTPVEDPVKGSTIEATMLKRNVKITVQPHHVEILRAALQEDPATSLTVAMLGGKPVMISIKGKRNEISVADDAEKLRKRQATPVSHAFSDYNHAAKMVGVAKADVMLHDDAPSSWVQNHEKSRDAALGRLHAAFQIG